jgi:hypothetical protein
MTFLLHNALDELKSIRPALAELKDWQHNMQTELDEVVKWQREFLLHKKSTMSSENDETCLERVM